MLKTLSGPGNRNIQLRLENLAHPGKADPTKLTAVIRGGPASALPADSSAEDGFRGGLGGSSARPAFPGPGQNAYTAEQQCGASG
ncbi:MAG: hypothetical protein WBP60_13440, partial [Gammaproteobacteria bacterium]